MSEVNSQQSIDTGIPEVHFSMEVFNTVQTPVDPSLSVTGMAADAKATGEAIQQVKTDIDEDIQALNETVDQKISEIGTSVGNIYGLLFPVGSIYVTTADTPPAFGGNLWRWQEIKIPATWGDLEEGYRSFLTLSSSDTPGNVHFWLRIADAEG